VAPAGSFRTKIARTATAFSEFGEAMSGAIHSHF
jgi:hypothetical protein